MISEAIKTKLASFNDIVRRVCGATMQVRPTQKMWEWIDEHVVIPQIAGSLNPGPLKTSKMTFYRGFYDVYWDERTRFVTICGSARSGKTLFPICCVLHKIDVWPGPILWVDPTRKTAVDVVSVELQAHILECRPCKAKAIVDKSHWKQLLMHFTGMILRVVGGGSPSELGGFQGELIVLNESDKIIHTTKSEASAHELAIVRSKQFFRTRKIIESSTPTTEWGRIWTRFKEGSQTYVYLPCPHCNHKQRLTFFPEEKDVPFDDEGKPLKPGEKRAEKTGQFKFQHCKDPVTGVYDLAKVERHTVYECASCLKDIEHTHLAWMLRRYELRSHNKNAPIDDRSFHVWAGLSPFENWGIIAKQFLQARGNVSKMHDFYNSTLGLPFVRKATDVKLDDIDAVIARSPEYMLKSIPLKPEILTMCVDVQGDCFWWSIRAWGLAYDQPEIPVWTSLVDYGSAVSWDQIEEIAGIKNKSDGTANSYRFIAPDGEVSEYQVYAGLIDSGFEAQSNKKVYSFTLKHSDVFSPSKGGGWAQLHGNDIRLAPVDDDKQDLVWYYDDGFKQNIYYGCIKEHRNLWWLPRNLGADYKEQACNEHTEEKQQPNGENKLVWVCVGPNHLMDTEKMHEVLRSTIESDRLDPIREEWLKVNAKNSA